jgi:hypothetical protein
MLASLHASPANYPSQLEQLVVANEITHRYGDLYNSLASDCFL